MWNPPAGSIAVMLLLTGGNVWGQSVSMGQISGIVEDENGGVLTGADVTVTQTETGLRRQTLTDTNGTYTIAALPVGPYLLDVRLPAFRPHEQTGIVLQINSSLVVNVTLELGGIAEAVTVQANASAVDIRTMGIGQVMDNQRILDLPLNGRNAVDLLQFLPGVVPQPLSNASSRSMQGGQAYSVAGGLGFGVSYILDGATHNNPFDNLNLPLPFPDALQEFKVETSALRAQNGMHSGGVVNAVTKSGTNQYRGDLFEFFRDDRLNAADPFAARNPDGTRTGDGLRRNQYGATLGGPINADNVFFFAGYQGTNTRITPTDNRAFVPTPAMLEGDFTAFTSPACNAGRQITLPAPFVGNQIDPTLFSRAALNISGRLPTTRDPCGLVQYGLPSVMDESQLVAKVDLQHDRHSMFGRYIATQVSAPAPFDLEAAQNNPLVTRVGGRDNLAQTFTAGENWVLTDTTLHSLRFAFNRTSINRTNADFFSAPEVGIDIYSYLPHYMVLTVGSGTVPGVNGFQLGLGSESPSTFETNAWQVSDDMTLVRGDHQFALGANVARWATLALANVRSAGQILIDGSQTGLPLTDFLLGKMGINGLIQSAPNVLDTTRTYLGVYAQDTWRLGRGLTLNFGLRWEPYLPPQFVNGAVYQFDATRFQQRIKSTVFPNAPDGLYFPGDSGFPSRAGMRTRWKNLGPRIGLAWDPAGDGRTAIRASYGKSFEFVNAQFHADTSVAPPWGSEIRINSPAGGLDDPFVGSGQTNIFPVTFDQNAPFSLNGPFLSLSDDMKSTHVHLWNVTVERQIGNWIASASYVGSRTNNIWETTPLNNALFVTVNGAPPSTANTNARRPLTLADPGNGKYYGPMDLYVSDGKQHYNGMILTVRRISARTTLNANYTLSRCYGSPEGFGGGINLISAGYNNPQDHGYDDGNCAADRLHNFAATAGIESPDSWGPIGSNWRLSGSLRAYSGPWLTITTGTDRALNGQVRTQRPNQTLDDPFADRSINPANGGMRYLNPSAFALPPVGTLGTVPRNNIRGMTGRNVDLVLAKNVRLANAQSLELRLEAFNALNWTQWGLPATALNAATFGQITSVVPGSPRVLQLGMKYVF